MINTFTKEIDHSNTNAMRNILNRNDIINNTKDDAPLRLCNRLFQTDFIKKSKHPTPKAHSNQTAEHITHSQSSVNNNMFINNDEINHAQTGCVVNKGSYLFKEKEMKYNAPFEVKKQELLENSDNKYCTFSKPNSVSQINNISNHNTEANELIASDGDTHDSNNLQEMFKVSLNSINDYSFQQLNSAHCHKAQ